MHRSQNGRVAGYVLIQAQPGNQVSELAELVARIPGVVKAERVHGAYDLIAEVPREHPGAPQAAEAIRRLDGVLR
ncbi:MAG: hypothetical protein ACRELA_02085, partial [Candidatus Rokuibacteriota bacterium]